MKLRQATAADCDCLAAMNQRLIRDEGHRNAMTLVELAERMRGWLAGEYQAAIISLDEKPVGYALFRFETEHVYVRQFFIEREFRRRDIGSAAIEHLRSHFWQSRPRLRLDVLVGNTQAIAFWRSIGFKDYCLTLERPS
jgi:ribosomal protein S18 acetylase RimI-like enzyme